MRNIVFVGIGTFLIGLVCGIYGRNWISRGNCVKPKTEFLGDYPEWMTEIKILNGWWESRDSKNRMRIHFDYRIGTIFSDFKWKDLDGEKFLAGPTLDWAIGGDGFNINLWRDENPVSFTLFRESPIDSEEYSQVDFVRSNSDKIGRSEQAAAVDP